MAADKSVSHIIQSLAVNLAITAAKGVAALLTGSGSMLAETIHSGADCGNQLLLLLGVKQSRKAPDASHPLGYGRTVYFWSFMVAQLLFTGGGVFSVYEGIHKIQHPEPIERVGLALLILGFSITLEGAATISNARELRARAQGVPFFRFLSDTKDSDLVVVFGENAAATLGLALAGIALVLAHLTGDSRWDAAGSLAIGIVLIGVAIFLAVEVKSLLVGESADPGISEAAAAIVHDHPSIRAILNIISIQQGPGEVMVALKMRFASELKTDELCEVINGFERELRSRRPEVKWCFVEPDVAD